MMDSRFVKIALCVGMLQIAGYYLSGSIADADSMMSAAQPDTLLYCQAARRIAEGHPFSFSHGEPVSTGTTSVLYPFVLSVPYAFGAKGDALLLAGFVLNALFYLLFLAGWTRVFCDLFESSILRFASILLLALSPQPAYCALAQSDIGLWMALSGLFASAFFSKKTVVYAVLLALGPWIRPEGMVLLLVFCAYAAWSRRKRDIVAALAGVASACGVFVFNHILTGKAQFSSVANKGYFITLGFPEAVYHTVSDMVRISKEFVFGMSELPPRMFFLIRCLAHFLLFVAFSHMSGGESELGNWGCSLSQVLAAWQWWPCLDGRTQILTGIWPGRCRLSCCFLQRVRLPLAIRSPTRTFVVSWCSFLRHMPPVRPSSCFSYMRGVAGT